MNTPCHPNRQHPPLPRKRHRTGARPRQLHRRPAAGRGHAARRAADEPLGQRPTDRHGPGAGAGRARCGGHGHRTRHPRRPAAGHLCARRAHFCRAAAHACGPSDGLGGGPQPHPSATSCTPHAVANHPTAAPLLHARDAMQAGSFVLPPGHGATRRCSASLGPSPTPPARLAGDRRARTLLFGKPDRLCDSARQRPLADPQRHTTPRRGAALGGARAAHPAVAGAGGVPAHGRRLWRQRNAGRAFGCVGRAGRAQVWAAGQDAAGPGRRHPDHRQTPPLQPRLASGL